MSASSTAGEDAARGLGRLPRRLARTVGEIRGLGVMLAVAGALLGFIHLADEVGEGETAAFDEAVLAMLRRPDDPAQPIGPRWLEVAMVDITSLGGSTVLTLASLASIGFLLVVRKPGAALLVALAVGGGALLSTGLKQGFDRPRPELVAHLVQVRSASFPSGHAQGAATAYLTLGALLARMQPRRRVKAYLLSVALLLTLLVGTSRVYLGVHWPTDVLAGWSIGAAWAGLCWLLALTLQEMRTVERDTAAPGDAAPDEGGGRDA